MSYCRSVSATFTTDASGDATVYTDAINGRVLHVLYVYDDAATGADITITTEDTARSVLTLTNAGTSSVQYQPRVPTHDTSGTALLYAAAGQNVETDIWVCDERLKIVVAQGGDTKGGTITVIVG